MAEGTSTTLQEDKSTSYDKAVENSLQAPPIGYVVSSYDVKYTYRFEDDLKVFGALQDCVERVFSKPFFCCGGDLKLHDVSDFVLKVKHSTSGESKADDWKEFNLSDGLDVEELLKYSSPATFGDLKEMKTKVDPEVRLANAIESERFMFGKKFEIFGKQEMTDAIWLFNSVKELIATTLTPGRYNIDLESYKLNIYSKGGFFQPHVDSPTQDNMVGTLVICLPSYHKGGELCVNHGDVQQVFDFSEGDMSTIQWAAFYSNCIHEVKPVLEGHRVTITYNIISENDVYNRRRRSFDRARVIDSNETCNFYPTTESSTLSKDVLHNLHAELEKICLRKDTLVRSPSKIGILLTHKYFPKGLQQDLLKGADKVLYDFLVGKNWKCKLVSVLSRYQTDDVREFGWCEDGYLDEWHQIYEFNTSNTVQESVHVPIRERPYRNRQLTTEYRKWRFGIPFIETYQKQPKGQLLRNEEGRSYWIGNQCEDIGVDKIYLDSALILEL